jgi:hypothetical protein
MRATVIEQAPDGQTWAWEFSKAGVDISADPGRVDSADRAQVVVTEDNIDGGRAVGGIIVVFVTEAAVWTLRGWSDFLDMNHYDPTAYRNPEDFRLFEDDAARVLDDYR